MSPLIHATHLLVLSLALSWTIIWARNFCPENSHVKELEFTKDSSDLIYACLESYTDLHCCMGGYQKLSWYQYNQNTSQWHPFVQTDTRYLDNESRNQTLVIQAVRERRDEGEYKCIGSTDIQTIDHTVELRSQGCSEYMKPPLPLVREQEFICHLGEPFNFTCTGFFGKVAKECKDPNCYIYWEFNYTKIEEGNHTGTYVGPKNESEELQRQGYDRTLYIQSVQAADYGVYVCWMMNDYGPAKTTITLKSPDPPTSNYTHALIIAFAVTIAVILLLGIVWWQCSLNLQICYMVHLAKRPSVTEEKEYDFFLLYCEDEPNDKIFAEETIVKRVQKDFKVFSCCDTDPGKPIVMSMGEAVDNCYAVIVILSDRFLQDHNCRFFVSSLMAERRCIYVMHSKLNWSLAADLTKKETKTLQTCVRTGHAVTWPSPNHTKLQIIGQRHVSLFWKKLRLMLLKQPLPQRTTRDNIPVQPVNGVTEWDAQRATSNQDEEDDLSLSEHRGSNVPLLAPDTPPDVLVSLDSGHPASIMQDSLSTSINDGVGHGEYSRSISDDVFRPCRPGETPPTLPLPCSAVLKRLPSITEEKRPDQTGDNMDQRCISRDSGFGLSTSAN